MAIRKVARLGHPVLREQCRPLTPAEIKSRPIRQLIVDMHETMEEYGGVGLAAPQVHEPVQVAIVGIEADNERYENAEEMEPLVVINPTITVLDETPMGSWEGCLSVPDLRGFVERPSKIRVDFLDEDAKPQSLEVEGFTATVFQHELDHLAGVVYVDKLKDPTMLAFCLEYARYLAPRAEDEDVEEGED